MEPVSYKFPGDEDVIFQVTRRLLKHVQKESERWFSHIDI